MDLDPSRISHLYGFENTIIGSINFYELTQVSKYNSILNRLRKRVYLQATVAKSAMCLLSDLIIILSSCYHYFIIILSSFYQLNLMLLQIRLQDTTK